jgi:lysozyme family protein
MKDNFKPIFLRTVSPDIEGGYTNDKYDKGGPTDYGITQSEYNAYRARKGLKQQSVRFISLDEAEDIYLHQYWNECKCDDLPAGVDWMVFDGAVNSGPVQSAKWLQRAINDVVLATEIPDSQCIAVDGHIGLITDKRCDDTYAVNGVQLILRIKARRMTMLHQLGNWWKFGKGWTNRVNLVTKGSLGMVSAIPVPKFTPIGTFPTEYTSTPVYETWWQWLKGLLS